MEEKFEDQGDPSEGEPHMTVLLPTHMMAQIEDEVIYEPTSRRNLAQTRTVGSSLRAESFHEQFVEEPTD